MTTTRACLFAAALLLAAPPAFAQSVYGCSGLERDGNPAIEGDAGVFYRIDPDMRMFHAFSDETVGRLAELSAALAPLGTTLVYVPLPTKSLAMPDQLPQAARDYGFDTATATTVHGRILERLQASGVATADLRAALRAAGPEGPSFFPTDYRLTPAGAARAARAIAGALSATPGFTALPKSRFETRPAGRVTLASPMRAALQRHCMIALPAVESDSFTTTRLRAAAGTNDSALFGTSRALPRIVLVGTEHAGEAASNLAGFLSEQTGLEVLPYTVAGGGSFAAISSYMTSREFQETPPAYLVWVNPAENNLARFGDQPLHELTVAAGDGCRVPLPVLSGTDANTLTADLGTLDRSQSYTLFVDSDGVDATEARFDFRTPAGLARSQSVLRHSDQVKTGRFFMPLAGLWPEGAQTVDIVLDTPFGVGARVTACFD